ncbi:MAG: relaxase/mobilization nuclease domain-containing protein [Solirubrobacteraceae bacterium]
MIPKITRGGNARGVLLYLIGRGRNNEHIDPHLVAGSPEAMRLAGDRRLDSKERDAAQLARFLDEPRETFGTEVRIAERDQNGTVVGSRDAHVWHCSLSLHPEEPALSDERWSELAARFIAEMGFAGEPAPAQCRWLAVRHGESKGGSDHVHLVVGLVAEDGSRASVHYDRPRAQQAARKLEAQFGLRALEARTRGAGSRGLERGEIGADRRRRGFDVGDRGEHPERSSRQRLERVVRACAGASRNESEFISRLADQGVKLRARYGPGGRDTVVGYSVRLEGPATGPQRTVWYGGGRLARDLSLPALRRGWGQDHSETARAVPAWNPDAARPPRSREQQLSELEDRGVMWHRCSMEIERVREQLRATSRNPDAAAHAAREGAAVLAAWSLTIEGQQPGALARASRQLARSAERRPQPNTGPPRQAVSRASGLALFMLAQGRPDSAVGWTLVWREVGLLGRDLARAHQAHGEVDRAQELHAEFGAELDRVRASLPQVQSKQLLDSETEAAQRAMKPLAPRERPVKSTDRAVEDVEAVNRLIDLTRRRRPRQR